MSDGGDGSAAPPVDIEPLIEHIRATRGFDFTGYKRTSLTRRFVKRFPARTKEAAEKRV